MLLPVDSARFTAFLAVMALLAATPGPANLFAIATGVSRGRRAALAGVAGMNAATLVWFAASALGLGALQAAFPSAFRVLAFGGAAYLAWLGVRAWAAALRGDGAGAMDAAPIPAGRSALRDGFAVQIANPKVLVFFTAVLPPFIDAARPAPPQLALFAAAMIGLDALGMSAYGLGGAALSRHMARAGFQRGFSATVGTLLLAAAGLVAARL